MSNETLFKAIREMVKQYETIQDEDEYRDKCIHCVYNTFNLDIYDAEIIYDLACFWEWLYLADNDMETEFNIKHNSDWTFTATETARRWTFRKSYLFEKTPIDMVLKQLNEIAREEFD